MAYHPIISLSDAEASFLTTLAASGKQIFVTKDGYDVLGKGKATRGHPGTTRREGLAGAH